MTYGSLFTGIGGIDLGLDRAGMECRWQVEIDPYALRVLEKHWPNVARYGDITKLDGSELEPVDLICGGFPCQDVSGAGRRIGIQGSRSGLWAEYIRLVRILRPRLVLVENVSGLLNRGMGRVLGDLAASGYDAQWDCIPAAAIGAPHQRFRVFIVAHANGGNEHGRSGNVQMGRRWLKGKITGDGLAGRTEWCAEPNVGRVAYGVPNRLDRLTALGNSVVPQIAEWIGRRIMEFEEVYA